MASGKTHDWITWALTPGVWLLSRWGFNLSPRICLLVAMGTLLGGLLLSPDLDTCSRPFYRWGVFRFIWIPYQWVAKHRSGLSHGIFLASWLRLLYLFAALTVLYSTLYLALAEWSHVVAHPPGQDVLAFLHTHLDTLLWLGAGIWLGCLLHIALDHLCSAWGSLSKRR
jgi:uncharacterized metal-binding protein